MDESRELKQEAGERSVEKLKALEETLEQLLAARTATSEQHAREILRLTSQLDKESRQCQRMEETLRDCEERFHLLEDGTRDCTIYMLDLHGRVVRWNRGGQRIHGFAAEDIVGRHFSNLYTPEESDSGKPQQDLLTAATVGHQEEEGWRQRQDGSRFWAKSVLTLLRDKEGQPRGFSQVTRDSSERKHAEEMLTRRAEELARSNTELEQFAYVASHDLQEPLRMVASFLELLAKRYQGQLDARADKYIAYAVDGATRMKALINDLLSYSRVGTRGNPFEPVDCAAVLDEVITNLQPAIQDSAAVVTWASLPTVLADAVQLAQLFQNLIGNALKFCENGPPRICVAAECKDGQWVFSVSDNGIGIAAEHSERIFLIFQRLHGRAKYPGTGIGLAICKKVVERHHGRIWVVSHPGQGSIFYFTIPAEGTCGP